MPPIAENERGLAGGEIVRRLVGGDAVFVEPGRLRPRLEDDRPRGRDRQRVRAGEPGRSGADDRDALARRRRAGEGLLPRRHLRVDRVALKQADPATTNFAATIGLDWADKKHDLWIHPADGDKAQHLQLEQMPKPCTNGWPSCANALTSVPWRLPWRLPGGWSISPAGL